VPVTATAYFTAAAIASLISIYRDATIRARREKKRPDYHALMRILSAISAADD